MSRVKFAAKHEYESLANFKILQNVFKAKKIDKASHLSHPITLYTALFFYKWLSVVDFHQIITSDERLERSLDLY